MTTPHGSSHTASNKPPNTACGSDKPATSLAACMQCRSRKVKCNRELPKCLNCQKSGDPCEFPDPEKKASQVKQLAENVAAFDGRLKSIQQNLTNGMELLTELVSQSVKGPCRTGMCSSKSPSEVVHDLSNSDLDDELPSGSKHSSETGLRSPSIIINDGPMERFYGESSTYSHLAHSRDLVKQLLIARNQQKPNKDPRRRTSTHSSPPAPDAAYAVPSIFAEVRRKYDSFSGPSKFREHFEVGDGKPLDLPPRPELENAIELYLSEDGLEPPLFQKQTLLDAVDEQYKLDRLEADESWVLCFSSIILRSSTWKSRIFRVNSFAPPSMDDNVLSLLLTNANRALRQLERFCVLRMVNVQGLFLLALVARDSIHYNVFERIFDRVCQLAKQMGLHERGAVGDNPTPEELERQSVLWVLYSVDKQRVFIRGPPCRIYLFECYIQLPRAEDSKQQLVATNLQLTCLVEEVYRYLYSPKASRQNKWTRQKRVHQLKSRLENLASQSDNILASAQHGSSVEIALSLQMRYAFYVTTLLIHSKSADEQSRHFSLSTARKALQIIQKLSETGFIFNGYMAVLERMFCSYSVIAFHKVFDDMLTDTGEADPIDLSLLTAANNALRLLSNPDKPYSYCTRLHKNFTWCTEIATLIHNFRKSASSGSIGSGSNIAESRAPSAFHQRDVTHKDASAPFSTTRSRPAHDFEGDSPMNDDFEVASNDPSSGPLDSVFSNIDPSGLTSFQDPLSADIFNASHLTAEANNTTSHLPYQVAGMPSESSDQFQDALQWVFDKGDDLDYSFQQIMTGQGMPIMPIGDDKTGKA